VPLGPERLDGVGKGRAFLDVGADKLTRSHAWRAFLHTEKTVNPDTSPVRN
jgi:hypothetical protein